MNTNTRILDNIYTKLAFLWVSILIAYLFGDKIRIFRSHVIVGEIGGRKIWNEISILMAIPVAMIFLYLAKTCIKSHGNSYRNKDKLKQA